MNRPMSNRSQGFIEISPQATAEYRQIIEDMKIAAASELESSRRRLSNFMQMLAVIPTN